MTRSGCCRTARPGIDALSPQTAQPAHPLIVCTHFKCKRCAIGCALYVSIYMYSLIWSSCPPWRRLYHSFCGCNRGVCVQSAKGGGGECMRIIRSARPNARVKWRTLFLQFSVFLQLLALKMYAHTCNNQWIIVLPELVSRRHALVQLTLEKAIYVAIACLTAANKT